MRRIALAAIAAMSLAGAAGAQPYTMTLAGASPQGLWSSLGVGLDRAMKAAYPGSTITYQTTGGGIANVALLQQKRAEIGIVHDAELRMAAEGREPFKAPVQDLRVIALLYNWAPMQPMLSKEFADKHGIKTFEDLAAKRAPLRVTINRRGNIASEIAERMLAQIGLTADELKARGGALVYAASEEQTDLMRDRRVDMSLNSLFVGQRSLMEMGQAVPLVMLPVPDKVADPVAKAMGIGKYTIKAGSYPWQPDPMPTVTLSAALTATTAMSDKDAYNIAKAVATQVDQIRGVSRAMEELTPKLMVTQNAVPYHPGAIRYFKEAGLMQ